VASWQDRENKLSIGNNTEKHRLC